MDFVALNEKIALVYKKQFVKFKKTNFLCNQYIKFLENRIFSFGYAKRRCIVI